MADFSQPSAPPIEGIAALPDETLSQSISKMLDEATAKGAARAAAEVAPPAPVSTPVVEPPAARVEPAAPPPEAPVDEEALFAQEAEKALKNPGLSKKQLKPWENATRYKRELDAARRESQEKIDAIARERDEARTKASAYSDYEELKTKLATASTRAAQLSALVDLENDPTFIAKYTSRAGELTSAIEGELLGIGLKKDAHKIKDEGGRDTDMDAVSVAYINQLGGMVAFARQQPQVYRTLLNAIDEKNPVAADNIRQNVSNLSNLTVAKQRELEQAKTNYQQFQQSRQQQFQQSEQQLAQQRQNAQKGLEVYRTQKYEEHNPFKITVVPEKATADERKRIEAGNKKAESLRQKLISYQEVVFMGKGTPSDIAEGTLRAALYEHEKERADEAEKNYRAAQAELDKINLARNPKPGSGVTPPPPARAQVRAPAPPSPNSHHNSYNEADDVADSIVTRAARMAEERRLQSAGNLSRA